MDDRCESPNPQPPARQPYEPPAVEESAAFETLALACGFNSGTSSCYYTGYSTS